MVKNLPAFGGQLSADYPAAATANVPNTFFVLASIVGANIL